jgi:CRP-like cAMP-binding protein
MSTSLFDQCNLFDNLTPAQKTVVRQLFDTVQECSGAVIFNQDDPAEFLYIVMSGEVHIQYKPYDGPALTVTRVREEGVVGWSAALGSPTYTSSAVCETDCTLLCVSSQALRGLCDRSPDIAELVLERLAAVIAKRTRNTHVQVVAMLENGLKPGMKRTLAVDQFVH